MLDNFTFENRARTIQRHGRRTIDFFREPGTMNIWAEGTVPLGHPGKTEYFALPDPNLYFVQALRAALEERGVRIAGPTSSTTDSLRYRATRTGAALVDFSSRPLEDRIFPILNSSQNWFAEMFVKTLGREVAIKVLPEGFSDEQERMARFEREAKVLASLNHKNVATLYGFETEVDTQFLVMEVVEGETLADRIGRGPITVDEAIELFLQIAEGLEAAHENGVIHRDLKPANIKVRDDGTVKVLDFGLAKALGPESAGSSDRKSTRLNSSHMSESRMPSSA